MWTKKQLIVTFFRFRKCDEFSNSVSGWKSLSPFNVEEFITMWCGFCLGIVDFKSSASFFPDLPNAAKNLFGCWCWILLFIYLYTLNKDWVFEIETVFCVYLFDCTCSCKFCTKHWCRWSHPDPNLCTARTNGFHKQHSTCSHTHKKKT